MPFQWSPPDAPLDLSAFVTVDNANVDVSVLESDSDAVPNDANQCTSVAYWPTGADPSTQQVLYAGPCNTDGCFDTSGKYGTWDAPPSTGSGTQSFMLQFPKPPPGGYEYQVIGSSGNPFCVNGPYTSYNKAVVHLDVA